MYNDFDKSVTDILKNTSAIRPSKNLAEAAIEKAMSGRENDIPMSNKRIKKVLALAACILIIAFGGVISFSESIRTTFSNSVLSIFTLEKTGNSYKVVQKEAATQMDWINLGGIPAENFSNNELVNKLGFEPFAPQEIGSCSKFYAGVGVNLIGSSNELLALNRDEILQSIQDDTKFDSLKKYNPLRFFSLIFSASDQVTDDTKIFLSISKATNSDRGKTIEKISDFSYKGVKCTFVDDIRPDYQRSTEVNWTFDDITKQPNGITKIKHIVFDIDDIHYSASYFKNSDENEFDYKVVRKFVEDYIDAYMSK